MQYKGAMTIIISPKLAKLKYRSRVESSGSGLIARLEVSFGGHKIRFVGA
jgi:hypothetical protein